MESKEALLAIIFVTVVLFLLVGFLFFVLILYRRKRKRVIAEQELTASVFTNQLLISQIEVQETTFHQIAGELHDNIGQLLSTALMLVGITQRQMQAIPESLQSAGDTLSKAIQELRFLSKVLDKDWLQQFNIIDNIQNQVDRINAGGVIKAFFESDGEPVLSSEHKIMLFRIMQEAIQNAIKHASAQTLHIKLLTVENSYIAQVNDDGAGMSLNTESLGSGMKNMKQRTEILGGRLDININSGGGTAITVNIPKANRQA